MSLLGVRHTLVASLIHGIDDFTHNDGAENQIELKYQRSICWLDKQLFGDPEQFQTPNSTWTSGWIAPLQPAIQRDELMMFVTSDHGEGMQEHGTSSFLQLGPVGTN